MDIFRAVLLSGEFSERALKLTETILSINAANYTVWYIYINLKNLSSHINQAVPKKLLKSIG